jgi:hypothetical protein
MRTLGANCTLDEIKELTGYQPALIRQIIKESKTKPKKPGVVSKTPEERDAPVFIKEIQKNTGLECVKYGRMDATCPYRSAASAAYWKGRFNSIR